MHHPTDRITHTTAFVTPVVEHWLEREIAQWVSYKQAKAKTPLNIYTAGYLHVVLIVREGECLMLFVCLFVVVFREVFFCNANRVCNCC